jgi:hypothetical protein
MALVTSAAASLKNTWGFSPQSIPGLQLWLDALDSNSITGTSSVTAWRNKGAAGGSASTTNGTISSSGSINSRSALSIGTNAKMTVPSLTFAQTSRTVFVVATLGGSSGTIYDFLDGTTSSVDLVFFTFGTGIFMGLVGVTATLQATFPSGSFNASSIICGVSTPASDRGLYVNGTALSLSVNSASPNGTGTFATQVTGSATNESPYTLGELLFFDGAITRQQQQQVEGYLAAKWGLQANLPATHPYSATASVPFNRPFYPTDIPGCTLWMDAADRSSMTFSSGSNISRWKDKSGQGNDFTVTEGTPVLSTTTIGNPGVFLPALSQMQSVSNAAENGAASRTSFFVADTPGGGGKQTQMGTGQINSTGAVWGFHFDRMGTTTPTSNFMFSPYTWGNDIFFATTPLSALTTSTNIGFGAYNSNTTTMTGNLNFSNSDSNKTITPNTAAGPWWMGDRPNGGFTTGTGGTTAGNSWICEFIQYSGVLTTQQRQQVESYLSWKWNTTTSLPFPAGHPGKLLPAFSTNFTPKSITGCTLWMDGADRSSMVFSGTTVTTWNDKSGNGLHGTATGTPTYTANALNGLGAPALNSNANFFKTPTFIISPTVGTPSIFMIMNQTAWGSGNSDFFQSTNSWQRLDFFGQGNAFNVAVTMNNAGPTVISATTTSNNPTLLSFVVNTASGGVGFANGTFTSTVGTAGGLLVQTDTYSIGGGPGFIGFIYELIVFNNTVSTSQRQQVEGYLAWKWGLQRSLPSTHAYAKFSP